MFDVDLDEITQVAATGGAAPPTGPIPQYLGRVVTSGGTINIGSAYANCLIVACIQHQRGAAAARTLTSLALDGTNGAIHVAGGDPTNGSAIGIVSRLVTVGGVIPVAWVLSGAVGDAEVDIFRIDDLLSTTPTDTLAAVVGNNPSGLIDFPASGCIIAAACGNGNNAMTWTGMPNVHSNADFNGVTGHYSSASAPQTSAASNVTVGITSASAAEVVGAVAWA